MGRVTRKRRARTISAIDSPTQHQIFEKQEVPDIVEDRTSYNSNNHLN